MATTEEVREIVIKPMTRMFGKPFGCRTDEELAATKADYIASLKPFPPEALRAAWADVRANWAKTTWPQIAVLRKAASDAQNHESAWATRSDRVTAAIDYLRDGTAWGPGMNMPYKALISARVAGLESAGLPKGKREELSQGWAEATAKRILAAQGSGK